MKAVKNLMLAVVLMGTMGVLQSCEKGDEPTPKGQRAEVPFKNVKRINDSRESVSRPYVDSLAGEAMQATDVDTPMSGE